jgi:hypothetical protein
MKKFSVITLAVLVCAFVAVPAFAAAALHGPLPNGTVAASTSIGGADFIPSTNVYFNICSSDSTGSPPNVYHAVDVNAGSVNNRAGREFQATATTPIQYKEAAAIADIASMDACNTNGTVITGFTNL